MTNDQKPERDLKVDVNLDTTPILYTDSICMTANPDGVVLDVEQHLVSTNRMRIVARIGMSRDHAKVFVKELNSLLLSTESQGKTGEKSRQN